VGDHLRRRGAEQPRQGRKLGRKWPPCGSATGSPTGFSDRRVIEVLTARELCALPDPDRSDELLGPLVVRGCRTIVGGHTGEGKTTFTAAIIAAIVKRNGFLEWDGDGRRALVLDLEQGLRTVKRVLREAGLVESDDVDYARIPDGLALDTNPDDVAAVVELLEWRPYDVVVLDPHYKAHRGESNEERVVVDFMRQLDAWRARFGFALILPVHYRKPAAGIKGPPTIHDLFGSSGLVRGAEVIVGIRRVSDGYSRLDFFKDREGELPVGKSWGLLFDRAQGFRRDPNDEEEGGYQKAPPRAIAEWIREQGGEARPGEIREHFDLGDEALRNRRDDLAELSIEYVGSGPNARYRVATDPAPANPRHRAPEVLSFDDAALNPDPAPPRDRPGAGSRNA
jgi:AAA domain